ncbi:hypothetical protein PHYSODRAFT_294786 [Phytophthora sojae]|uniref:Uncharacterized protein n=1 Tax=Phytophthora sojae (strain P6497) TaxID=1094619 RepID=G4YL37_PHYSP|nr:hypothetical protein PHYSODRAFT_294786 [Phytophthora sojae]EGZ29792.1 hypothetical protein PHYSODRAFT_294786 [Phytophthora sojae]|eukprot:XP_009517067.1 hypothetical protein PHYSODRAFT_294786 [Phytophthora sojae]
MYSHHTTHNCYAPGDIYRKDESVPIPSTCGGPDDEELSFKLLADAENEDANTVTASMEVHESQVISQPVDDQMLFSLESWRFEEYIEAVRHGDFFRSVKNVFSQVGAREEPLLIEAPSDEERKEDENKLMPRRARELI